MQRGRATRPATFTPRLVAATAAVIALTAGLITNSAVILDNLLWVITSLTDRDLSSQPYLVNVESNGDFTVDAYGVPSAAHAGALEITLGYDGKEPLIIDAVLTRFWPAPHQRQSGVIRETLSLTESYNVFITPQLTRFRFECPLILTADKSGLLRFRLNILPTSTLGSNGEGLILLRYRSKDGEHGFIPIINSDAISSATAKTSRIPIRDIHSSRTSNSFHFYPLSTANRVYGVPATAQQHATTHALATYPRQELLLQLLRDPDLPQRAVAHAYQTIKRYNLPDYVLSRATWHPQSPASLRSPITEATDWRPLYRYARYSTNAGALELIGQALIDTLPSSDEQSKLRYHKTNVGRQLPASWETRQARLGLSDCKSAPPLLRFHFSDTDFLNDIKRVFSALMRNPSTPVNLTKRLFTLRYPRLWSSIDPVSVLERLSSKRANGELVRRLSALFAEHRDYRFRAFIANYKGANEHLLKELASDKCAIVRGNVARNVSLPSKAYARLANDGSALVRYKLAQNPRITTSLLLALAEDSDLRVRAAVASARPLSTATVGRLLNHDAPAVLAILLLRRDLSSYSAALLKRALRKYPRLWMDGTIALPSTGKYPGIFSDVPRTLEEAVAESLYAPPNILKVLVASGTFEVKRAVASNPSTPPSFLRRMAESKERAIVRAVASNGSTPAAVLERLVLTADEFVLGAVAKNPNTARETLRTLTEDSEPWVLHYLVGRRDEVPREVLQAVAESRRYSGVAQKERIRFNNATPEERRSLGFAIENSKSALLAMASITAILRLAFKDQEVQSSSEALVIDTSGLLGNCR